MNCRENGLRHLYGLKQNDVALLMDADEVCVCDMAKYLWFLDICMGWSRMTQHC